MLLPNVPIFQLETSLSFPLCSPLAALSNNCGNKEYMSHSTKKKIFSVAIPEWHSKLTALWNEHPTEHGFSFCACVCLYVLSRGTRWWIHKQKKKICSHCCCKPRGVTTDLLWISRRVHGESCTVCCGVLWRSGFVWSLMRLLWTRRVEMASASALEEVEEESTVWIRPDSSGGEVDSN